jgi:hypothetical protein
MGICALASACFSSHAHGRFHSNGTNCWRAADDKRPNDILANDWQRIASRGFRFFHLPVQHAQRFQSVSSALLRAHNLASLVSVVLFGALRRFTQRRGAHGARFARRTLGIRTNFVGQQRLSVAQPCITINGRWRESAGTSRQKTDTRNRVGTERWACRRLFSRRLSTLKPLVPCVGISR